MGSNLRAAWDYRGLNDGLASADGSNAGAIFTR